ncbi:MAG: YgfZ/GcvT domain-containing protein [Gemmatimonadaceae bacterium]
MPPTLLFDRSDRARIEVTGAQAVATLNGLVTNDVAMLKRGQGEYAAALTAKGKIIADLRILMLDDGLLLDTSARAAEGLRGMLGKYVNPRFATQRDVSETTGNVSLVGPGAMELLAGVTGLQMESLTGLLVHSHLKAQIGSASVTVLRARALGADLWDVFDLIVPRDAVQPVMDELHDRGATLSDASMWQMLRVEAGTPEWGVDMDDSTLLQEANLEALHAVSYTKGCYVGQETVARIHFRGHVNRTLRRLNFTGDVIPPEGATLTDAEHRSVGEVRSRARSDTEGVIGIGMVRREIDDGAALDVRWEGGGTEAMVMGKAKGSIE